MKTRNASLGKVFFFIFYLISVNIYFISSNKMCFLWFDHTLYYSICT